MIKAIESIVKARDDRTIENPTLAREYLYSIMLSHIEPIKGNVYNCKFIGRTLSSRTTNEIYMNMQIIVNDSSAISNSKYSISDSSRSEYVKSYNFDKKENISNSYRIDLSINTSKEDDEFFIMELVNQYTNQSSYIRITLETFFKASIFIYNMLDMNIIDGDIFLRKINKFRLLTASNESFNLMHEVESKLYTIYWNQHYILFHLDKNNDSNFWQCTYCIFKKEEYDNQIKYSIGDSSNDETNDPGVNNIT